MAGLVDGITGFIGMTLWGLFRIFFVLIDWVQSIFRSLAGLAPIKIDGNVVNEEGSEETYDIVYYLLQTDIIRDVFFSMFIFSIILMFLMLGLAIIRNAYQDKPKPVMSMVGQCFKGLLGILLLPIACLVGLMFGNLVLMAVDSATGAGGSQSLSGTLFLSSAYEANVARAEYTIRDKTKQIEELINNTNIEDFYDGTLTVSEIEGWPEDAEEWELLADAIDRAYIAGTLKMNNGKEIGYNSGAIRVAYGYKLMDVNYIVLLVGGVIMLGFIFKMCLGMINRIFKLCIDFVLIPPVMAMLPFDESASKAWKKDFVSQTTLAYGTVGALNLYFSILPIVDKIDLVSGNGAWFNVIFHLILEILGLFAAESMIKTISGWFGTGDLIGEGTNAWKTVQDKTKKGMDKIGKGIGTTGKFVGAGMANIKQGAGFGKNVGNFLGGGLKAGASTVTTKMANSPFAKSWNEGMKAGKTKVEDFEKYGVLGITEDTRKKREANYAAQGALKKLNKTIADSGITDPDDINLELKSSNEFNTIKSSAAYNKERTEIAKETRLKEKMEKSEGAAVHLYNEAFAAQDLRNIMGDSSFDGFKTEIGQFLRTGKMDSRLASAISALGEDGQTALKDYRSAYIQSNRNLSSNLLGLLSGADNAQITDASGTVYTKAMIESADQDTLRKLYEEGEVMLKGARVKLQEKTSEVYEEVAKKLNDQAKLVKAKSDSLEDDVLEYMKYASDPRKADAYESSLPTKDAKKDFREKLDKIMQSLGNTSSK